MSWSALGATVALVAALTTPVPAVPGCPGQQVPSPPAAREEFGRAVPVPLPWPIHPVGGPELGGCGTIGPPAPATVTVSSYVVADLDSGAVLAARAPHERQRPASTLKILTSLVALHELDPDTVVDGTAADQRIDGSRVGMGPGGRYTVRQLLQGLLLNSGNDTAEALARTMGGDAATVAAMTATARQLGALDTRPATPSGLDGPGMATSAYDLALLFRVAMRDPLFATTLGSRSAPFPGYPGHPGFVVSNSDRFLAHYPDAIAGKSGFTDGAHHTLVAAAERGGRRLVVVLVRGEQHPVQMWQQAGALLDAGFARPASTPPIGVLVDSAPVDDQAPAAVQPGPAAALLTTPDGAVKPDAALGLGLVVVLGVLVILLRRRRRRG